MGLGKTLQTLAFLGGLMVAGTISKALIVAPASVVDSWTNEARKWLANIVPNLKIVKIDSKMTPKKRRKHILEALKW